MNHAEGGSTQQVTQQVTDQVTDPVSDPVVPPVTPPVTPPVGKLLEILGDSELSTSDLMAATGISDRMNLIEYQRYPALKTRLVERTIPDKPNSRLQKYRRTK